MTNHLQESRMREIYTSGLMQGLAFQRRPAFSTLLLFLASLQSLGEHVVVTILFSGDSINFLKNKLHVGN